jgi:hypothetical protein
MLWFPELFSAPGAGGPLEEKRQREKLPASKATPTRHSDQLLRSLAGS